MLANKIDEEIPHWAMYPSNVHMATKGKKSGGGASLQTKKTIAVIGLVILVIALTILGYVGGNKYGFGLLSGAVSLVLSIITAVFLYSKLMRDKLNENFESDPNNKVLKLFRIRLNDSDVEQVEGVDLMSYTSGQVFVTLQIEIGNSSFATQEATGEFIERIFKSAHQLHLGIKNYNTLAEWRKSDVYHEHLKRLTKIQDSKLRGTLAKLDAHQSLIFDEGQVNSIHLSFVTRRNNLHGLKSLIQMVNDWEKDYSHMSSIRVMKWLNHEETVQELCQFLTIEMLDVTSNMNKNSVKYADRQVVRVYSKKRFNPKVDIQVESIARQIRSDRRRK